MPNMYLRHKTIPFPTRYHKNKAINHIRTFIGLAISQKAKEYYLKRAALKCSPFLCILTSIDYFFFQTGEAIPEDNNHSLPLVQVSYTACAATRTSRPSLNAFSTASIVPLSFRHSGTAISSANAAIIRLRGRRFPTAIIPI